MLWMCVAWLMIEGIKTGIYAPISPANVAVSESGKWFVLDMVEQQVVVFEHGSVLNRFGTQGEGPGAFNRPVQISWDQGKVFITDVKHIHLFSENGEHLDSWRKPDPFLILKRTGGQWVGFSATILAGETQPVFRFSEGLKRSVLWLETPFKGRPLGTYALFQAEPQILVDRTAQFTVVVDRQQFVIQIFLGQEFQVVAKIHQQLKPLAMDLEWAGEKRKLIEKDLSTSPKMKPYLPPVFPPIRKVFISPENHLLIFTWSPNPNNPGHVCFSLKGAPTKSKVTTIQGASRVLNVHQNKALVATLLDGEVLIHQLPFAQIDSFVSKNPLRFDYSSILPTLKNP